MPEMTVDKAPRKVRDLFNKGFAAFERANYDYAIDMLTTCLQLEPAFHQARKFLRAAEIKRFRGKKSGMVTHLINTGANFPAYCHGLAMLKARKPAEALDTAEKLLQKDPLNLQFIRLFSSAALASGLAEAAVQTLEMVREYYPEKAQVVQQLGSLYQEAGRTREARECFEKLCQLTPNDPDAVRALKDALARESMSRDKWEEAAEKGGSFRDIIKDKKEAVSLEQEAKAVKTEKDSASLIAEMKVKIEAEPANVNYYRALARLYAQAKQFDEAVDITRKAVELNRGDPQLDNLLSTLQLQRYDFEIEQLQAAGDAAGAEAKEDERVRFEFEDLQDRVQRYPNDLELRYEWGVLLYRHDRLNESIQQFQLSQRNPNVRHRSLYYMGLCFKEKQQFDMAREQLKKATLEMPIMDETKKDICYELGQVLEAMGDNAGAAEYYKQVYQADIGYKDIAERMERFYSSTGG